MKLSVPLMWGRISRGPSLVASRVSSTLSRFRRERGIFLETVVCKRASTRVEGRISWFFSRLGFLPSCDGDLRDPRVLPHKFGSLLEVRGARQDSSRVAAGE